MAILLQMMLQYYVEVPIVVMIYVVVVKTMRYVQKIAMMMADAGVAMGLYGLHLVIIK